MPIGGENIGTAYVRIIGDGDGLRDDIKDDLADADGEFEAAGERHGKKYGDAFNKENDRTFAKTIERLDRAGDSIGRLFGKGSRNDFVNIIGAVTGGITRMTLTALPRGIGRLVDYGRKLGEVFNESGPLGVGTQLLADVSRGVVGLTAALATTTFILGPVISLFSTLAGVVTALAASISAGLIGGLGALVGTILPAGAALAVFIGGVAGLSQTGAGKAALKSLGSAFKDLSKDISAAVFPDPGAIADRIAGGLRAARPLLISVGKEVGRVFDNFLDIWSSPAGRKFLDVMEARLPSLTGKLGDAFNHTFSGLLGLLRGLVPITDRFLTWLVDITSEFDRWSNSVKGQNGIKKFFDDAGDSAARLGDFLGAVWDFLGLLITQGRGAGDTLFGDMTRAIEGWNRAIESNPDILGRWFADAVKVGRAVGDLAVGIATIFDTLDNEVSRSIASSALEILADTLRITGAVLRPLVDLFGSLSGPVQSFLATVAAAAFIFPRFNNYVQDSRTRLDLWTGSLSTATGRARLFAGAAKGLAGVGGLALIGASAKSSNKEISTLGSTLGGALTGLAVGGPWGAAIGGAAGLLAGLFGAGKEASAGIDALTASLDKNTGALTANSREVIANALNNSGILETARNAGLALDTVTQAAQGNVPALRDLSAAWQLAKDKAAGAATAQDAQKWLEQAANIQKVIEAVQKQAQEVDDAQAAQARLSQAMGKTREVSDRVVEGLKGFPKRLVTSVDTLGIPTSLRGIRALTREFHLQPKQVTTLLKIAGLDVTRRQARLARVDLKNIPARAETKLLLQNYAPTKRQIGDIQRQYNLTKKEVKTLINQLGGEKVLARLREVQREADKTDKKKPTPKIDLLDSIFNGKAKAAENKLNDLDRKHPTPKVDVITGAAMTAVNNIISRLNDIHDKSVTVTTHYKTTGKPTARGGMFFGPEERLIGEAGPEAVVPLDRPLDQVDPSVRWLSALAQGISTMGSTNTTVAGGKTITVAPGAIQVTTPSTDPVAVATETLNALVGSGYN